MFPPPVISSTRIHSKSKKAYVTFLELSATQLWKLSTDPRFDIVFIVNNLQKHPPVLCCYKSSEVVTLWCFYPPGRLAFGKSIFLVTGFHTLHTEIHFGQLGYFCVHPVEWVWCVCAFVQIPNLKVLSAAFECLLGQLLQLLLSIVLSIGFWYGSFFLFHSPDLHPTY